MADVRITLQDLVELGKAALRGNTSASLALPEGDPLLALIQANALADLLVAQNIEGLVRLLRASTSTGSDLDSWMDDFEFARLPAVKASGTVRFAVAAAGANIPAGTMVASIENGAVYEVVEDGTNSYWSALNERYEVPATANGIEIVVPVQAVNAGASSNVGVNTLVSLPAALPNVNSVTNRVIIVNGRNAEGDTDYRERFKVFLGSLGKATEGAIVGAIQSVLGARANFVLVEHADRFGNNRPNYFTVVAENGSGVLSPLEEGALIQAITEVKGFAIGFDVTTPNTENITIMLRVVFDELLLTSRGSAESAIQSSISSLLQSKKIGDTLYYSEVVSAVMALRSQYPVIRAVTKTLIEAVDCADYIPASSLTLLRLTGPPSIEGIVQRFATTL